MLELVFEARIVRTARNEQMVRFLFALSVESVVPFVYALALEFPRMSSCSWRPPEHDHIPQFAESRIEQNLGSDVGHVVDRWNMFEFKNVAVSEYLHPFLSDIDMFHSRFDDSIIGKCPTRIVVDL